MILVQSEGVIYKIVLFFQLSFGDVHWIISGRHRVQVVWLGCTWDRSIAQGTLDDMVASSETSDHVSLIFGKGAFKARFVLIHAGTQIWIDMVLQRANTCVPPFGRCGASGVSRVSWTRRKIDSVNIRDVGMRGKGVLWRFTAQMRVALLRACLADRQLHLGTNLVSREAWLSCSIINMVYRGEIWHLYDLHGVGTVEICMILYTAKMPSSSSSQGATNVKSRWTTLIRLLIL